MTTLALPSSLDLSAIERADLAPRTRVNYTNAIDRLFTSGVDPFDYTALANHAATLPASVRAALKAALNHMTAEYEHQLKASVTVDNLAGTQVQLYRLQALNDAIKVRSSKGKGSGTWLSNEQIEEITALPDRTTQIGRRDWIVLAMLLGAGLRRSEMAGLTFEALKQQPTKNGVRYVLDITGKGAKKRVIPISPILARHLESWKQEIGGGRIARGFIKGGTMTNSLSDKSINEIVGKYGQMIGVDLEAHDCRRSWAQCGLNAGIPITQISVLLGHSSVSVTQRYLDLHVSLDDTISDYVPLSE